VKFTGAWFAPHVGGDYYFNSERESSEGVGRVMIAFRKSSQICAKTLLQLEIRCSIRLSYGRNFDPAELAPLAHEPQASPHRFIYEFAHANQALKIDGTWVFDDPAMGLTREPFIAGIDTIIDNAVADIPNARGGFRAIFSAAPFPGADFKLEWRRGESGGNWYYSDQFKMEGWLCPALFKYFAEAPREIYVKTEASK
jgi:hypothetical protein